MVTIRKLRGKWQAIIRKKDHKHIAKTFINKITASKWAKDVEARMDRNIYEDFTKDHITRSKDCSSFLQLVLIGTESESFEKYLKLY